MVAADCSSHRVVGSALCGVSLGFRADIQAAGENTYLGFADRIGFAAVSVQVGSRMRASAVWAESRCGCCIGSRLRVQGFQPMR